MPKQSKWFSIQTGGGWVGGGGCWCCKEVLPQLKNELSFLLTSIRTPHKLLRAAPSVNILPLQVQEKKENTSYSCDLNQEVSSDDFVIDVHLAAKICQPNDSFFVIWLYLPTSLGLLKPPFHSSGIVHLRGITALLTLPPVQLRLLFIFLAFYLLCYFFFLQDTNLNIQTDK